ncbi:hypothetical protein GQ55_2G029200 [Panicum hallii var. hallii]|uniref:Uncharacterized protein n=1 Tax=Panicum hallii var. hallii TaxID=1504633 RepID=A0A2T7EKT8_9POAL|nr:hypothetical protein GQ55_2G029200 [Panicum hallii var. hallii]
MSLCSSSLHLAKHRAGSSGSASLLSDAEETGRPLQNFSHAQDSRELVHLLLCGYGNPSSVSWAGEMRRVRLLPGRPWLSWSPHRASTLPFSARVRSPVCTSATSAPGKYIYIGWMDRLHTGSTEALILLVQGRRRGTEHFFPHLNRRGEQHWSEL